MLHFLIELGVFIWDLDLIDRSDPIAKFTRTFKDDYIRKETTFMALEIDRLPGVSPLIKIGHHLFGYMVVTCPDCIENRAYFMCAIYGKGGWFSEVEKGRYPSPFFIGDPRVGSSLVSCILHFPITY